MVDSWIVVLILDAVTKTIYLPPVRRRGPYGLRFGRESHRVAMERRGSHGQTDAYRIAGGYARKKSAGVSNRQRHCVLDGHKSLGGILQLTQYHATPANGPQLPALAKAGGGVASDAICMLPGRDKGHQTEDSG